MESERSLAVSAPSDEMLNLEKFAPLLDGRCSGLLSTSSTTSKCKNAIFYRSRDCDYTSIEGPSEVNDKDIDETNYDYCFSSPKEEGTCQDFLDSTPVQTVDSEDDDNISEFLYDSWYEELDDMLKDYVDVGGSHYEESDILSCLEGLTEKSAENSEISCLHDATANQMCGEKLYSSSTFDTDEDRNRIYDQWLLDLVTWERNRLMWLDDVSEIEGFDSLAYADRTFLIQVSDESAKTKGFSSSPENGTPRTESNDCDKLLKIEEYRNPHYRKQCQQHHECLCNLSYTNKYHNVLQDLGAAEILSTSLGDIKEGNWKENSCNETCSNGPCVLKRQNLLKEKLHVPHDVVLVYQFTDRNFWKKK